MSAKIKKQIKFVNFLKIFIVLLSFLSAKSLFLQSFNKYELKVYKILLPN
jgi:hypothetical protein